MSLRERLGITDKKLKTTAKSEQNQKSKLDKFKEKYMKKSYLKNEKFAEKILENEPKINSEGKNTISSDKNQQKLKYLPESEKNDEKINKNSIENFTSSTIADINSLTTNLSQPEIDLKRVNSLE